MVLLVCIFSFVIEMSGEMTNKKIHTNSTISDAHVGAHYIVICVYNFYLGTDMPYHQYMRVHPYKILK